MQRIFCLAILLALNVNSAKCQDAADFANAFSLHLYFPDTIFRSAKVLEVSCSEYLKAEGITRRIFQRKYDTSGRITYFKEFNKNGDSLVLTVTYNGPAASVKAVVSKKFFSIASTVLLLVEFYDWAGYKTFLEMEDENSSLSVRKDYQIINDSSVAIRTTIKDSLVSSGIMSYWSINLVSKDFNTMPLNNADTLYRNDTMVVTAEYPLNNGIQQSRKKFYTEQLVAHEEEFRNADGRTNYWCKKWVYDDINRLTQESEYQKTDTLLRLITKREIRYFTRNTSRLEIIDRNLADGKPDERIYYDKNDKILKQVFEYYDYLGKGKVGRKKSELRMNYNRKGLIKAESAYIENKLLRIKRFAYLYSL